MLSWPSSRLSSHIGCPSSIVGLSSSCRFSAFWAAIDWLEIPAIERHRLHEPEELKSRNRVTLGAVIKAVLVQHAIQTALGLLVLEQAVPKPVPHDDRIAAYARAIHQLSTIAFGSRISRHLLAPRLDELASFAYWWAVPALQYIWALCVDLGVRH